MSLTYNKRMEEKALDKKYTDFINNLVTQVKKIIPQDINQLQSDYLKNNLERSSLLLAQSMQEEKAFSKLDFKTKCTYLQIMAEWSFHKEIDLFRSGIPAKHWKPIMQKIWATMWDVMFACVNNNATEEVLLDVVEKYVNKTYLNSIEELKKSNIINEETLERAKEQSNIKIMAQELQVYKKIANIIKRALFILFLGITIGLAVSFIVFKFKMIGIIIVLTAAIALNVYVLINNKK